MIYLAVKAYEDFYRLEYKFLKKLLKCTGVATSGYSKMELIASRFQVLKWIYKLLCQVQNIKSLRLEITINSFRSAPVTERINNIYDWPRINLGLFYHVLKARDYQRDYIGCYNDEKACSYFDIGFINEILLDILDVTVKIVYL